MATIIILLILLALTAATFVAAPLVSWESYSSRGSERKRLPRPRLFALIPLALFLAFLAANSFSQVGANKEGVLLTFKKPDERVLDSGLKLKLPWQQVVEVDGSRKTDNFNDGKANEEDDPTQDHSSIQCRLGDNGVATVKASITWKVKPGTSNRVYQEYRADDPAERMREDLVVPRFRDAVNQVCGTYRPTAVIDQLDVDFSNPEQAAKAIKNLNLAPDFDALGAATLEAVEAKLKAGGELVEVINVSISYLELPESSQGKINEFLDEASKTRIALQSQATNTAQAEANRILAESKGGLTELVLVSRCLDLISDGKLDLPAGGSCWPGGGSGVVIPGGGKQ